jgi:hypothetical protein
MQRIIHNFFRQILAGANYCQLKRREDELSQDIYWLGKRQFASQWKHEKIAWVLKMQMQTSGIGNNDPTSDIRQLNYIFNQQFVCEISGVDVKKCGGV